MTNPTASQSVLLISKSLLSTQHPLLNFFNSLVWRTTLHNLMTTKPSCLIPHHSRHPSLFITAKWTLHLRLKALSLKKVLKTTLRYNLHTPKFTHCKCILSTLRHAVLAFLFHLVISYSSFRARRCHLLCEVTPNKPTPTRFPSCRCFYLPPLWHLAYYIIIPCWLLCCAHYKARSLMTGVHLRRCPPLHCLPEHSSLPKRSRAAQGKLPIPSAE